MIYFSPLTRAKVWRTLDCIELNDVVSISAMVPCILPILQTIYEEDVIGPCLFWPYVFHVGITQMIDVYRYVVDTVSLVVEEEEGAMI